MSQLHHRTRQRQAPIGSRSSVTRGGVEPSSSTFSQVVTCRAAVLHSSGYSLSPGKRAAEFNAPILIMHGTADGPADGGGPNNRVELARDFEAAAARFAHC